LKAEPRQLDQLVIPRHVLKQFGLPEPPQEEIGELFPERFSTEVASPVY
jgi:hypothetical protein